MSNKALLEIAMRHKAGTVALDVAFSLTEPWTVLFGPSGAGKSTVLRVIAGLVRPDKGQVVCTMYPAHAVERRFVLTDTEEGVLVPPHQRVIRYVGQAAALFPHRTVRENVAYKTVKFFREEGDAAACERRMEELLALCRIEHLAEKMPVTLSGGEQQRVAIARAIAPRGMRALLLDEPFTALDFGLRDDLLRDLKQWLREKGVPVLHVTHDVGEVFASGAEVIRMEGGRVVAQGPASAVLASERETLLRQLEAR